MTKDGIFVCGSPYAETALLTWALGQHESISAGPASNFLYSIFGKAAGLTEPFLYKTYKEAAAGGSWLATRGIAYPDFLRYLGAGVELMFSEFANNRRWIESSPENSLFIDELSYMFPRATFLVPQEDPEYVLRVLLYRKPDVTPAELKEALEASAVFRDRVREVASRRPNRVIVVEQRALITDPARRFADLLEFVGEDATPAPAIFFSRQTLLCGVRADALARQRSVLDARAELVSLLPTARIKAEAGQSPPQSRRPKDRANEEC